MLKDLEKQAWFDDARRRLAGHVEFLEKRQEELEAQWGSHTAGILEKRMSEALEARGLERGEIERSIRAWDPAFQAQEINARYEWIFKLTNRTIGDSIKSLKTYMAKLPLADVLMLQRYSLMLQGIIEGAPPEAPPPPTALPPTPADAKALEGWRASQTSALEQAVVRTVPYNRAETEEDLRLIDEWMALVKHDDALLGRVLPAAVDSLIRSAAPALAAGALAARGTDADKQAADLAGEEGNLWLSFRHERGETPVAWFSYGLAWQPPRLRSTHEVRCTSPKVPLAEALRRIEAHMDDLAARLEAFAKARTSAVATEAFTHHLESTLAALHFYGNEEKRLAAWLKYVREHHDFGPTPEDLAKLDASYEAFQKEETALAGTVAKFAGYDKELAAWRKQEEALEKQINAASAAADGKAAATAGAEYAKVTAEHSRLADARSEEVVQFKERVENEHFIADPPKGRVAQIWLGQDAMGSLSQRADYIFTWDSSELLAGAPGVINVEFDQDMPEMEISVEMSVSGTAYKIKAARMPDHRKFEGKFMLAPPRSSEPESQIPAATDAPHAKDKPVPRSRIAGPWEITYHDRAFGDVNGTATVGDNGTSVEVVLKDPKYPDLIQYRLNSIAVAENGDFYTIQLQGKSPAADSLPPGLFFPKDTNPFLTQIALPADATKIAVKVGEVTGEKFIGPRAKADYNHVELLLKYWEGQKSHENLAEKEANERILARYPPEQRAKLAAVLEAGAKMESRGRLTGWWSFQADDGTLRDAAGSGRIGFLRRDFREPNRAWQFDKESWTRPPSKVTMQLFAKTAAGLRKIEEIHPGVQTIVEFIFNEPQKNEKIFFHIEIGGESKEMGAVRDPDDFRRFLSDVFLPGEKPKNP